MIIDRVRTTDIGDAAIRSARVRWRDQVVEIQVRGPHDAVQRDDDASGFLVIALLPAMTLSEDLEVDAPASQRVIDRLQTVIGAYAAWNPLLRPPQIGVPGLHRSSRGVWTRW